MPPELLGRLSRQAQPRPDAHHRRTAPGDRTDRIHPSLEQHRPHRSRGQRPPKPPPQSRSPDRCQGPTTRAPRRTDQRVFAGSVAQPTLRTPQGRVLLVPGAEVGAEIGVGLAAPLPDGGGDLAARRGRYGGGSNTPTATAVIVPTRCTRPSGCGAAPTGSRRAAVVSFDFGHLDPTLGAAAPTADVTRHRGPDRHRHPTPVTAPN